MAASVTSPSNLLEHLYESLLDILHEDVRHVTELPVLGNLVTSVRCPGIASKCLANAIGEPSADALNSSQTVGATRGAAALRTARGRHLLPTDHYGHFCLEA